MRTGPEKLRHGAPEELTRTFVKYQCLLGQPRSGASQWSTLARPLIHLFTCEENQTINV